MRATRDATILLAMRTLSAPVLALALALVLGACSGPGPVRRDASVPADGGVVPSGLAISLVTGPCQDLGVPHVDESDPLFGFEVTGGPPDQRVEIWAEREQCDVTPFFFVSVELDAEGRGRVVRTHPGTTACDDNLIGGWTVFVMHAGRESERIGLSFVNGGCAAGPTCAEATDHCPTPAP